MKKVLKRLLVLILLFAMTGGGFYAYTQFYDVTVTPDLRAALTAATATPPAPAATPTATSAVTPVAAVPASPPPTPADDAQALLHGNGYIALMGVNAPANVENTYAWALALVEADMKPLQPGQTASAWDTAPGKITVQGDYKPALCMLSKGWEPFVINGPCTTTIQQLNQWISGNTLLLTRYHSRFEYSRFIDVPGSGASGEFIREQQLFLAYLVSVSHAHPEGALQEWLKNAIFLKKALADQTTLMSRSVLMVMYQQTQKVLPTLLAADPSLAAKYQPQLADILAPFGPREMNIVANTKAEERALAPVITKLTPGGQAKFKQFWQDEITLAQTQTTHISEASDAFHAKYANPKLPATITKETVTNTPPQDLAKALGEDAYVNLILAGIAEGADLFKAMEALDARNRILNLYVQMKVQTITPDKVGAFIQAAALHDPFTDKPFAYDAAKHLIYFSPVPGTVQGLLYN